MRLRFRIRPPGGDAERAVEVEVEAEAGEVTLGRRPGVAVPLPFPAVSGLHARVLADGQAFSLADAGSANGTFLRGRRLPARGAQPMAPGDELRLADVVVVFEGPVAAADPAALGTATLARRLVSDLFQGCRPAQVPRLVVEDGPAAGRALELAVPGRVYRLGRAPDVDLALPDDDVSREHATVERGWDGVRLRDLGSKNGIWVGKALLTAGGHPLRDGEVFRLGQTRLRLEDPEERYLREMEQEPPPPTPDPPPPPPPPRRVAGGPVALVAAVVLAAVLAVALWLAM